MKRAFEKFLRILQGRPALGGLEISDFALRFSYFDGARWQLKVERIEPGVLEKGEIKNAEAFKKALAALREQVRGASSSKRHVNVVVSLSSADTYSQVFSLPIMRKEEMEKAIALNLQVVSPAQLSENYAGWQFVSRKKGVAQLEILSAFINQKVINETRDALLESGFFPVAVEFKALSIARLLREQSSGFDAEKSYFMLTIDPQGIDLLILRHGELYFEYFTSWKDVQGSEREISNDMFRAALVRNLHQLLNFYTQHWPDQPPELLVSAGDLNDEVFRVVKENFTISARELTLKSSELTSADWLVVLGVGLRSIVPRDRDTEINFLGKEIDAAFRRAHLVRFAEFWRVTLPLAFGVLLAAFLASNIYLMRSAASLAAANQASGAGETEIRTLEAKVQAFNQAVTILQSVRRKSQFETPVLERIGEAVGANAIRLNRLEMNGAGNKIVMRGEAASEAKIRLLKEAIESDGRFGNVSLPFADIQRTPQGTFSFSLSFTAMFENVDASTF